MSSRVLRAMATVPPQFDAARMVSDYREWAYEPLAHAHAGLSGDRFGAGSFPSLFGEPGQLVLNGFFASCPVLCHDRVAPANCLKWCHPRLT